MKEGIMISYLKGLLISKNITATGCKIVVEVNNIGYEILVNKKTCKELPDNGNEIIIHTSLIHKEDSMLLCGFLSGQEKEIFSILQTVSGIGIKAALLILELPLQDIISAVINGNEKVICKIKGIGPKIAKRLILELKEKMINLKNELALNIDTEHQITENFAGISCAYEEAQAVLSSLGYTSDEINLGLSAAAKRVENNNDTQEILQTALAVISGS